MLIRLVKPSGLASFARSAVGGASHQEYILWETSLFGRSEVVGWRASTLPVLANAV